MRFPRKKRDPLSPKFERLSRELFGSSREDSLHYHTLSKMYYEDWYGGIIPFVYQDTTKFKVVVSPASTTESAMLLFSRGRDHNENNEAIISGFLSEAVQLLIIDGSATFEIVEIPESPGTHALLSVVTDSLEFLNDIVIQSVPKSSYGEAKSISLSKEQVFTINAPTWIEGEQGFSLIIKNLIKESKRDSTPVNHFQMTSQGQKSYFNFSDFRQAQEVRVLNLTKQSGWQGRTLYDARITEYYFTIRFLRFTYNCFRLREYLIDQLNAILLPQLKKLGSCIDSISIEGLPKPEDILEVQRKLEKGEIGFKEAIELSRRF